MSAARVEISDLSVRLRGRRVLSDISVVVENEVLGIAGANGSGKSTLIRAIESATRGRGAGVRLSLVGSVSRPQVGYLPQHFTLPRQLTIRQCVAYAAWVKGLHDADNSIERALRDVHLSDLQDQPISRSSGGVVQRAGFASVLVDSPDILLLDEPTTGVDITQRAAMRDIIAAQSRGRATILSSHIVEDLEQLCDRILVLVDGGMAFLGTALEAQSVTNQSAFSTALGTLVGSSR